MDGGLSFSNQQTALSSYLYYTLQHPYFHQTILKAALNSPQTMASITMTATSLAGFAVSGCPRRGLIVAKASSSSPAVEPEKVRSVSVSRKQESFNGRRDLVFAAAAAAAATFAGVAMADEEEEEPKKGSAAAKKKYAPICVSMPTARICHNIK